MAVGNPPFHRMHVETLKVFCDLVEMQSFSLAAERNFVTQSAVSQQIRTLEEKFDRKLLERVRGRREIKLTAAGEVFYRDCKNVLEAYDQMTDNMNSLIGKVSPFGSNARLSYRSTNSSVR